VTPAGRAALLEPRAEVLVVPRGPLKTVIWAVSAAAASGASSALSARAELVRDVRGRGASAVARPDAAECLRAQPKATSPHPLEARTAARDGLLQRSLMAGSGRVMVRSMSDA